MFEIGLSIVGQRRYNQERIDHRLAPVNFANYLVSARFHGSYNGKLGK